MSYNPHRLPLSTGRLCRALAGLLLLTFVAGCGNKGDPLPPLRTVPLPIGDLSVSQQGQQLFLDMGYPATTVSGMALGAIDAVELFELVRPAERPRPAKAKPKTEAETGGDTAADADATPEAEAPEEAATETTEATEEAGAEEAALEDATVEDATEEETGTEDAPAWVIPAINPQEFAAGAKMLLTLRGTELGAAISGDRIQIRLPLAEPLPDPPTAHFYAVRTVKGEETSDFSNRVAILPTPPPPPPYDLAVKATPRGVELTWVSAANAEGFDVFRREAQLRGYGEPLHRTAGDARTYLDTTAVYGRRYIYTVRTVASLVPLIHSTDAGEVEIEYVDRFPPPLPRGFVALGERGSVRLRWDPSEAKDVAGYILYRREPGRDFHRITEELVVGTEYIDRGLVSGLTYAYQIQAVDTVGNESRVSEPVVTTLR